jgi:hypothetical protein
LVAVVVERGIGRKTARRRRSKKERGGEEDAEEKQTKEKKRTMILLRDADEDGDLDVVLWWEGGWGRREG